MAPKRKRTSSGMTYQVFLSFRGPDTRQGFSDVMYHALVDAGIRVFRDDEEIRKGEDIGEEILKAIEDSRIFVPIFSRSYASSKWCLIELAKMFESKEASRGKKILPIFYDVDVDDVKLKTELFAGALLEHKEKFSPDMVQQWEEALRKAGKIKGWKLKDRGHGEFSKSFVREVSLKLKVKHKYVTEYLVQRDDQVKALMNLLDTGSSDVRFVGIHGMGGIGKTTLAKVVFNKICSRFDCCSFLADVRESSQQHKGIEHLQKQLLSNLGLGQVEIMDVDDGIIKMRGMLREKKVLVILDDVDQRKQIQNLAGDARWFGSGSRIIITSRNKCILESKKLRILTLELEVMKPEEALRLFSMYAFEKEYPPEDYLSLSEKAVASTGQLPLALEVIGSLLRDRRRKHWADTIKRFEKVPHEEVQEKLRISYDDLDPRTKQIFLDIACFFINHEKEYPIYMWEACKFDPEVGVKELIHLSLVKIIKRDLNGVKMRMLWMHDQLRDLGRKIVRDESFEEIAKQNRFWMPEDALEVLLEDEDKENIEMLRICTDGISSDGSEDRNTFTQKELSSLRKLRYIQCSRANFSGDLKHLLPKLRWLSWQHCPEEFIGTDLYLRNLVILDLSWSSISETWGGWSHIRMGSKLKVLDLTGCNGLRRTPDFSNYSSLERLILASCSNLVEIDPSIGKLKGLKHLDLKYCHSLEGLPEEFCCLDNLEFVSLYSTWSCTFRIPELIGNLKCLLFFEISCLAAINLPVSVGMLVRLRRLSLSQCSGMERLPDSLADMKSLVELFLIETDIVELPQTIGRLVKLELLHLRQCRKLKKLPDSIGDLRSLTELDLSASRITKLPDTIGNLKKLRAIRVPATLVEELPTSVGMLERLEELDAEWCDQLSEIPSTIKELPCLRILNLGETGVSQLPPKLPITLTELHVSSTSLRRVPELSKLHNLVRLVLSNQNFFGESGQVLPSKLQGIGKLGRLVALTLRLNITSISRKFSSLSRLQNLTLKCADLQSCPPLPSSLLTLILEGHNQKTKLPQLSNLKNLSRLEFCQCSMKDETVGNLGIGELDSLSCISFQCCDFRFVDGFRLPESLRELRISSCDFLETISALSHVKNLKKLSIFRARRLVEIQELGELESLQSLIIQNCDSLERVENLSKLKKLRCVEICSCKEFKGIDDISNMEPLEDLFISGCDCEDVDISNSPGL